MKKYSTKMIMKRAWEIKKEADRKTKNALCNKNIVRPLEPSEKAVFSECLKMAWAEAKRAEAIAEEHQVSYEAAAKMAAKEAELKEEFGGNVTFKIWSKYGKTRAYYTVDSRSSYQNSDKRNFVEL